MGIVEFRELCNAESILCSFCDEVMCGECMVKKIVNGVYNDLSDEDRMELEESERKD